MLDRLVVSLYFFLFLSASACLAGVSSGRHPTYPSLLSVFPSVSNALKKYCMTVSMGDITCIGSYKPMCALLLLVCQVRSLIDRDFLFCGSCCLVEVGVLSPPCNILFNFGVINTALLFFSNFIAAFTSSVLNSGYFVR